MKRRLYSSLALRGLVRNRRASLPYLLSCAGIVMMYFLLQTLAGTDSLTEIYGARTLRRNLEFGSYVMMVFSVIVVFYTHSFLMRQRKKELGLYAVLGMEKRHIGRVLLHETLLTAAITLALGIGLGMVFAKLLYMILLRLLGSGLVPQLHIPQQAYWGTVILFLIIHGLTLLNALRQVAGVKPAELLRAESLGEKDPPARVWLALFGLLSLGAGYYLSLSARDVIQGYQSFFIAVLLVILGTYALFLAGSVSLLKALRKNKRFYYQPRHFSVVAGLIHRMKRNATGLATICILSTMVLVMISTTASLFIGTSHHIRDTLGRDAVLKTDITADTDLDRQAIAIIKEEAENLDISMSNEIRYRTTQLWASFNKEMDRGVDSSDAHSIENYLPHANGPVTFVPAEDYGKVIGRDLQLLDWEVLAYSQDSYRLPDSFSLFGQQLHIKERLSGFFPITESVRMDHVVSPLLVMKEQDIRRIVALYDDNLYARLSAEAAEAGEIFPTREDWEGYGLQFSRVYAFDTGTQSTERVDAFYNRAQQRISQLVLEERPGSFSSNFQHAALMKAEFNAMFGGLLFVAVFLGLLFMMAMVLIIYYKQVSEGYEDAGRFTILRQVGMSQREVKRTIKSQVLLVFFLPLVAAAVHTLMAFNILTLILDLFSLSNRGLYAVVTLITFLAFSLIYLGIYLKTAQTYYKIVNQPS